MPKPTMRSNAGAALILAFAAIPLAQPAAAQSGAPQDPAAAAFRDSTDAAPPGWTGPAFKLSHDYPTTQPNCDAPWLKRKVSFDSRRARWNDAWKDYIADIVRYIREGQDPDLRNDAGWKVDVAGARRWYHVPWMSFDGERGREFVHGLTNELSTSESTFRGGGRGSGKHVLLGARKKNGVDPLFETWSVGMYNPCGAWSLGQVFPASGVPATTTDPSGRMFANGMPFPQGTVVIKLLNTTADESDVPYLKGSTSWQANGHKQTNPNTYSTCEREVRTVHLVQVDIAVVDKRSPTRWVYSTLSYDGRLPGKTVWDRLRPLGVQWGSDGGTFPAVPMPESRPLYETILAPVGTPEHYGCQKRLAGVVDQANSSCVSCHMGAYASTPGTLNEQGKNIPAIFIFSGMCTDYNPDNAHYFSDYKYPATFPGGQFKDAIPLDSSLQVAVAFAQYGVFKNMQQAKPACSDPLASGGGR